jgi:2-oxopent-4-enoate/cis-2-oxohex-4-enoate hydratase
VQQQLGLRQPAFGHLFATEFYRSGAVFDAAAFDGLAIEGEFAVRIAGDLSVGTVFPVIELHNNVFRRAVATSQELIANNALHAGVVLGAREILYPDAAELIRQSLSIFLNGELLGTSTGGAIPGGPLSSLAKVAGHLASAGGTLKLDQIVLTGSPLPLYPVRPGDHIVVRGPQSTTVELTVRG